MRRPGKKYAQAGLFAKTKREFETFFKSLQKEKITKLDMSNIKTDWQKEIVEYIVNKINDNIFLFIRLNDNNINNDIINTLYLKKKNISFIPSFAYGYKKSSYVMEFAQNYILMPTLNPKRDFNHAAFQIQSLNKESYMLFGEDTKDFIFTLENETPVKKHKPDDDDEKDKVFISLNLQLEDMTSLELRPNNFEIKQAEPRKKRLREEISLSDVLSETNDTEEEVSENGEETVSYSQVLNSENIGEMPDLPDENLNEIQTGENNEDFIMEDELDYFEPSKETEASVPENEPIDNNETETAENIEEISPEIEKEENKTIEREADEILNKTDEKEQQESIAEYSEDKAPIEPEVVDEVFKEDIEEISNKPVVEAEISEDEILDKTPENKMPEIKQTDSNVDSAVKIKEDDAINVVGGELIEFAKTQENIYPVEIEEEAEKINEELIDEDILDAIDEENGKNSPAAGIEETKDTVSTIIDEVVQEKIEDKLKSDETVNKLDKLNNESLNEASLIDEAEQKANDEIEAKFEAIMNETKEEGALNSSLQINENVSIDLEKIKKDIKTPEKKLPVFDDEKEETENIPSVGFKEGEKVSHEKYGTGTILKVIKYSNRCLLQIEFPEIGKRLLDPKIAKLQIAEEV